MEQDYTAAPIACREPLFGEKRQDGPAFLPCEQPAEPQ